MTDDIRQAFGHPVERATATASGMPDRISLRDYIVEVEIGAFQQERGTLQRVKFNVVVEVAPLDNPIDDDVDRILSYDRVIEAISAELDAERINLLETLAARIADRILLEPQADRVFVRIEKLDRGPFALGVEIVRSAEGHSPAATPNDAPHPRILHIADVALTAAALGTAIAKAQASGDPLIITVSALGLPLPQATHPLAQRRIDLLAIEQAAWVLAAKDPRCTVVETRTEIDWAMKNGQICIWAPSKIVLDAVGGPGADVTDPMALSAWFAIELQAVAHDVLGDVTGDALPENHKAP